MRYADAEFLNRAKNMEDSASDYGVRAVSWLHGLVQEDDRPAWAEAIDKDFRQALKTIATFYGGQVDTPVQDAAKALQESLACWRGEPTESRHPLIDLARLLDGNPGDYLEYRGPVLSMTVGDVLQGIAATYILNEWDLNDEKQATAMFSLCVIAVAEIAIAVYWSSKAQGHNLGVELRRLFKAGADSSAFRSQMANLVLAGHAATWGHPVGFMAEGADKTPDWYVESSGARLWVECTSFQRTAEATNDEELVRCALGRAWHEKKVKFSPSHSPGLIAVDLSGVFVSREHGTILKVALGQRRIDRETPEGGTRTFGIYDFRSDTELAAQESNNRQFMALMASALNSREAIERGIRGMLSYQGQQILFDVPRQTIQRPKRSVLAWSGRVDDPEFGLAVQLCGPAIPLVIPNTAQAPFAVFLV